MTFSKRYRESGGRAIETLEARIVLDGQNGPVAAQGVFVPPLLEAAPDNPVQTVRAIVLNFEPTVPSEGNRTLWQIFNWNDPRELAAGYIADMEAASGGAVDYEIAEWRDLNEFPIFTDGFRYDADQYVINRRSNSGWAQTSADFYAIARQQGLAELVNTRAIDEIWMFGDHYFGLLGEAWMAGPNSFFINGPTFPEFPVDRAVAGYGFSYERGVAEMLHNHGHRTENHGGRAYGGSDIAQPKSPWDYFTANASQTQRDSFGIGSVHYPFNAAGDYDYSNNRTFPSYADEFVRNYPDQTYFAVDTTRDAWGNFGVGDWQRGYLNWFFAHVPRAAGTSPDGRQNNWYKYIYDFNAYRPNTGLPRDNEGILGAPPLTSNGQQSYEFTVRYYDTNTLDVASLDGSDLQVTGPNGFNQRAELVHVGPSEPTTAGTARTVRYRLVGPGGAWNADDAGVYKVSLRFSQVRDSNGNWFPAATLGEFRVNPGSDHRLDVLGLLRSGQATVTATQSDIGNASSLFDGQAGTLYRTPNIDPAVVTLTFTEPQTVSGFGLLFSNELYRWTIEGADNLGDLNTRSGSYRQLVPTTNTSTGNASVQLAEPVGVGALRLTADRRTGDNYVHIYEWTIRSQGETESAAPTAELISLPNVTSQGRASEFTVRYSDDRAIDVSSINFGDVRIVGPKGFAATAALARVNGTGTSYDVPYFVTPPGGFWDASDNGTYVIELRAGEVFDVSEKVASAGSLGTFVVDLPLPQWRPLSDLTENNANDWRASADLATAEVTVDSARKTTGASSLRFDTTGGFDTSLRYEPSQGVVWDLTGAVRLQFQLYAENSSPIGFQVEPIVRLVDLDGDAFEYRYYRNGNPYTLWNDARNRWLSVDIPLGGTLQPRTGWRATREGSPDLSRIATIEIHADTWDAGFSLWFDAMHFEMAPPGDSNLDGRFDSADLVHIFQTGEYEDSIVGNSTWLDGDWDGDREFTTADLVLAFQSGGYAAAAILPQLTKQT